MREVDLTGNNGFTLDNNEVIINHTDSSIIIEDKMNISSFLPSIKEDAIKVLATDYKSLLDKLYKLL